MFTAPLTDPNLTFLLMIVGIALIFWELHAPGMIVPGLLGVCLVAGAAYAFYQDSPSWYGITLLLLAMALLTIEFKYYTHMISGLAGTVLLAFGAMALLTGPRRITPEMAISTSVAFGLISVFLGLLGMRARKSKPRSGLSAMIGQIGISQTKIDPEGTVLIRGEYWKAVSDNSIAPGQQVEVQKVQNLLLYVRPAQGT